VNDTFGYRRFAISYHDSWTMRCGDLWWCPANSLVIQRPDRRPMLILEKDLATGKQHARKIEAVGITSHVDHVDFHQPAAYVPSRVRISIELLVRHTDKLRVEVWRCWPESESDEVYVHCWPRLPWNRMVFHRCSLR
jgi:hypothetical protein